MPYIRLYSPELTLEVKRDLSRTLTESALQALQFPDEARHRTFIHFIPYSLEDMAIAGTMLVDSLDPEYLLEVHERNLDPGKKEALVSRLTAAFSEVMQLAPEQAFKIHILIQEYSSADVAIGGQFISELDKNWKTEEA
jgi:phenylpyruvate tautomerase PptA (4-oxalocrotonate tautomerase family)